MDRISFLPLLFPKNKRRSRKGRVFPPTRRSARRYVYTDPSQVRLFRYFLEAEDNLGIMTVVDRWRAALLIRFSPDQEQRLLDWLEEVRTAVPFVGPLSICSSGRTLTRE